MQKRITEIDDLGENAASSKKEEGEKALFKQIVSLLSRSLVGHLN